MELLTLMEIPFPYIFGACTNDQQPLSRQKTQDPDFPLQPGEPFVWSLRGREERTDEEQSLFQSKGNPMFPGDPLTCLTHGVQCSETRQLRLSHVIFSIVPCTWVRLLLSILYEHYPLLPKILTLGQRTLSFSHSPESFIVDESAKFDLLIRLVYFLFSCIRQYMWKITEQQQSLEWICFYRIGRPWGLSVSIAAKSTSVMHLTHFKNHFILYISSIKLMPYYSPDTHRIRLRDFRST